jgi:hypothetical protein
MKKWQHLDLDGKKIEHGALYRQVMQGSKDTVGTVTWSAKNGYVIEVIVAGKRQYLIVPYEYRGNRVVVYRVRRVND